MSNPAERRLNRPPTDPPVVLLPNGVSEPTADELAYWSADAYVNQGLSRVYMHGDEPNNFAMTNFNDTRNWRPALRDFFDEDVPMDLNQHALAQNAEAIADGANAIIPTLPLPQYIPHVLPPPTEHQDLFGPDENWEPYREQWAELHQHLEATDPEFKLTGTYSDKSRELILAIRKQKGNFVNEDNSDDSHDYMYRMNQHLPIMQRAYDLHPDNRPLSKLNSAEADAELDQIFEDLPLEPALMIANILEND